MNYNVPGFYYKPFYNSPLLQYHRQLDICFGNGAKRISRNSYLGFGKSYLIPETINFDIGEGIIIKQRILYASKWSSSQ